MQAEAKKLEDFSTYLSLPSTKLELEEKGHSMAGKGMQNLGSCTISKDSFQISTLVCSTKLTQNGRDDNTVLGKKVIWGSLCVVRINTDNFSSESPFHFWAQKAFRNKILSVAYFMQSGQPFGMLFDRTLFEALKNK